MWRAPYAAARAGWDWDSEWGQDVQPLLEEMLSALGDGSSLRSFTAGDPEATLRVSVVGEHVLDLVSTAGEAAERHLYDPEQDEPFEPFLDGDRVGLVFSPAALAFLSTSGAILDTHISFELGSP
jgi:hypothetical protein